MSHAVRKMLVYFAAYCAIAVFSSHAATIQQNDPSISYGGSWFSISNGVFSGGSAVEAMDPGAAVTVSFTGTAVTWTGYKDPWSGIAQVYLDGTLTATVDTYSAAQASQAAVWQTSGLTNTTHTLKIVATYTRNSASRGYWVWVDSFQITTAANTIILSPDSLPTATQGQSYSALIQVASGGQPGYHFNYTGTLPPGTKIDLVNNCCSVVIHGVPTAPGTYNLTLSVADNYGNSGSHDYSITVVGSALAISPASLPNGTQGVFYGENVFASGGQPPYTFSISSGVLPPGMTAAPNGDTNYYLSGAPTSGGRYNFTVQVQDAASQTSSKTYSITIASASGGGVASATIIQQNDPAIAYSGTWFTISNGVFSGGSAIEGMDAGNSATITFTGTAISWIGYKDPWSGIAQVYLDGALAATVDTYSARQTSQTVVWQTSGLAQATHTLKIVVAYSRRAPSGGYWVWIDGFRITN
jgi:hypothetical protein